MDWNLICYSKNKIDCSYKYIKDNNTYLKLYNIKEIIYYKAKINIEKEFILLNQISFTEEHIKGLLMLDINTNIKNYLKVSQKLYIFNLIKYNFNDIVLYGNLVNNIFWENTSNEFLVMKIPEDNNFEAFWNIIIDRNIKLVIVVKEGNDHEFENLKYYYTDKKFEISNIKLNVIKFNENKDITYRKFKVDYIKDDIEHNIIVKYIEIKNWNNLENLLNLNKIFKKIKKNDKLTLLHCFNGFSYSGTIIGLYYIFLIINKNNNNIKKLKFSIFLISRAIREQIFMSIANISQYTLLYKYSKIYLNQFINNN